MTNTSLAGGAGGLRAPGGAGGTSPTGAASGWIITYADMMTLLLTLFVVSFSMSNPQQGPRARAAAEAMRRQFGGIIPPPGILPGSDTAPRYPTKVNEGGSSPAPATVGNGQTAIQDQAVRETQRSETLLGQVYFEEGSAELNEEGRRLLGIVLGRLAGSRQKIELRGHASSEPLPANSPYRDHWHLASARADAVRAYLTSVNCDPRRMRVASSGAYEPKIVDANPRFRRLNNRVEIYTLHERVHGAGR